MSIRLLLETTKLEPHIREYTRRFLKKECRDFLATCNIVTIEADKRFVSTGERVDKVWITLSGTIKVMEELETGENYIFTQFSAPAIFGEMETLADIGRYSASLVTVTECVFLVGSSKEYLDWLKNDIDSLYHSTQKIIKNIMGEGKMNRAYLLLNSLERIKIYLVEHYKQHEQNDICTLKITRQDISDEIGYSVKTVNRIMKRLKDENLINITGQSIVINREQYNTMLKSVDDKISILKE